MEFPARVVSRRTTRTCLVHELGAKRILPENDLKPMSPVKSSTESRDQTLPRISTSEGQTVPCFVLDFIYRTQGN